MNIREQIKRLRERARPVRIDECEFFGDPFCGEVADTMERLLAVYEAAIKIRNDRWLNAGGHPDEEDLVALEEALAAVQENGDD